MHKLFKRIVTLAAAAVLIFGQAAPAAAADTNEDKYIEERLDGAYKGLQDLTGKKDVLSASDYFLPGDAVSDWTAMALKLSGHDDGISAYVKGLREYLESECASGGLDRARATDFQRMSLAILMMGEDPQAFAKDPDGNYLDLVGMGTYAFREGSPSYQGSNALAYALLAMNSAKVHAPEGSEVTEDSMIEELLSYQQESGGFPLSPAVEAYPDVTAMVVQALAPYRDRPEVKEAVDKALVYLSENQSDDGGVAGFTGEQDCETIAQYIMTLSALGIDPFTDERFIKNGNTLLDAMDRFRLDDGTYMHVASVGKTDVMATESAMIALISVKRMRDEGRWLFDTEGIEAAAEKGGPGIIGIIAALAGALAAGAVIAFVIKRKNSER